MWQLLIIIHLKSNTSIVTSTHTKTEKMCVEVARELNKDKKFRAFCSEFKSEPATSPQHH